MDQSQRRISRKLFMLWLITTLALLFIGYMMVVDGFPTTPTYGRVISSIVFFLTFGLALWKLYCVINKRDPYS